MTKRTASAIVAAALAALGAALSSCGGAGGSGPDDGPQTTAPYVTDVSIADGSDDVGLIEQFRVTFSEAVDPATIHNMTVFVSGRAALGHVTYDEASRTAVFTPDTLYAAEIPHYLTVSAEITDLGGEPMASADTTSFTTGPLDCAHLEDHLEPNDTTEDAEAVEFGRAYRTLCICGDDVDLYTFTLEETATVAVTADVKHAVAESMSVRFVGPDGSPYQPMCDGVVSTGDSRTLSCALPPGVHGVTLSGREDAMYVLYDLTLEITAAADNRGGDR